MTYSVEFFTSRREKTLASAQPIVDYLWEVIEPDSVLDIGCATGIWLAQAERKGAKTIYGIDGPWVPKGELEIKEDLFFEHDLSKNNPANVASHDLAFCIEVAEHLAPEAADRFIDFLTSHAEAVLFSAAIPGQGGTGHLNEQPQSYWYNKFKDRKFECFDVIRPRIWDNPAINVIYKQNMLLYVRIGSRFHEYLRESQHATAIVDTNYALDRIHPYLFHLRIAPKKNIFDKIMWKFNSIRNRFRNI